MSEKRNEHFENFVLFLLLGGLLLAGILYVLFALWPYLIFYVAPVVLGSFVVCGILRLAVQPSEGQGLGGLYQYKNLAVAFAAMIAVVYLVFYSGSERRVEVDKKGNMIATYLEWPRVHQAFNELRRESYRGSFFESLKKSAEREVMYDRQEIGFMAWVCLFLFGPGLFWYYSKDDAEKDREVFFKLVHHEARFRENDFKEKSKNLDQIIASRTNALEKKLIELENARATVLAENQVLKAKLEFSSEVMRPSESGSPSGGAGLLDQGIL